MKYKLQWSKSNAFSGTRRLFDLLEVRDGWIYGDNERIAKLVRKSDGKQRWEVEGDLPSSQAYVFVEAVSDG